MLNTQDIRGRPSFLFWLWSADGRFHTIKRGFDILGSLFLLPVMLAIGLVLLVANPLWNQGPLFFTQRRVGRNGVPFAMVKFRTVDAQGRVSSFAALLRARRVDEVPQVFNVLAGEMSLIGPRPEQPDYVAAYAFKLPGYMSRHEVRPGISGLAQVEFGYAEGLEETAHKLRFDIAYTRQRRLSLEAYIVWATLRVLWRGTESGIAQSRQRVAPKRAKNCSISRLELTAGGAL